jgi:2-polyprenyl-3-methyl-5-hydroxy-6-metoxy-1,4-benzoquinol methylase
MPSDTTSGKQRWESEAEFFDHEEYSDSRIPEATVQRYLNCANPYSTPEFPFVVLGDVRGKRILELGCGDGSNAVLLALKGATVVGIDVSARAIAAAQNKARLHQVADRTEFHVLPLETYLERVERPQFDIICGFAVLHHLLPVLDGLMTRLQGIAREDTVLVFSEPVMPRAIRRIRLRLPIPLHATPDERPLDRRDLAIIRRHFPAAEIHLRSLLLRLWALLVGGRYEDYSRARRLLYQWLCRIDRVLVSIPGLRALAAIGVIVVRPSSRPG